MKKLVAILLMTAMTLSLTACGNTEKAPADATTTEDKATTDAAATDTAASGDTFVIGGIGPVTGDAASYGLSVKQGAEIAIKEINDAGGVMVGDKAYTLTLNFADDEASEDKAINAYNSLMDSGINALLGTVTSGSGLAIVDLTAQDGILQLTPSASAVGCIANDNAFRLCFTDPLQGTTMADYVTKDLALKKVAVLYDNSSDYSSGIYETFKEQMTANGGEVVAEEAYAGGDVDFKTQLTSIKNTDAEIIFVPGYYTEAAAITQQAKELGITLPFLGSDGWDGVLAAVTDKSAVEGAIFLSPFLATDEAVKPFVTAYETAYKAIPDQFAADGYDCVYVIKAATEQAGSIESADLIAAMTEIQVDGLTGSVKFNADGEPDKGAKFILIKDGEYTAK